MRQRDSAMALMFFCSWRPHQSTVAGIVQIVPSTAYTVMPMSTSTFRGSGGGNYTRKAKACRGVKL